MSIWDKYPNFSPIELRRLVALTGQALLESAPEAIPNDLVEISPRAAASELLPILQEQDPSLDQQQIQQLLEDENLSTQVCLKVLDEVRKCPDLAKRIAQAYDDKAGKMVVTETLLLTGAIVILATRISKITWTKGKKEINFDKAGATVKSFIVELIKSCGI